jgi:putative ABC transport system ATP-binding protein
MTQGQALLSIHNLGRQVAGRWLWRGVSFELQSGERLGLVAPSGAGKTLLMRSLVLLDPVQEGQIACQGRSLRDWALPNLRRQLVYLPQRATAFPGTVRDNLQRALSLKVNRDRASEDNQDGNRSVSHGNHPKNPEPDSRMPNWLQQLGRHPDFLDLQAQQLSGGETQILALLRALQLDPQVLLLDEPTASLDSETTDRVEALLKEWLQPGNRAFLLTSHDRQQIDRFTTRQINLKEFRP